MKNFGALTLLTILAVGCVSDNASVAPRTTVRLHRTGKVPGDLAAAEQTAGTNTLFGSNALSNASSPQGIAPYITQASTAAALSETNSLSTVNTPRAATPAGTVGTAAVPGAVSGPAPGSPSGGGTSGSPTITGTTPLNPAGSTVAPATGTPPVSGGTVPPAPSLGNTPGAVPGTPIPGIGTVTSGANTTGIGTTRTGIGTPLNPAAGGSLGTGISGSNTGSAIGLPSNTVTGTTNSFLGNTNLFGPRP